MSTTQCVSGGVSGLYATGKALLDAGVIAGNDVTPEAALTKLSYVISKKAWSIDKKRLMMQGWTSGERAQMQMIIRKNDFVKFISPQGLHAFSHILDKHQRREDGVGEEGRFEGRRRQGGGDGPHIFGGQKPLRQHLRRNG